MWVPLHVRSQYSVLNATPSVEELAAKARALGVPAIALTDQGNLYGAVEFYKACVEEKVRPIIGCELAVAPRSRHEKKKVPGSPAGFPLVLLAKNRQGYSNLCHLTSLAHTEGFYYTPRIDRELLAVHHEGLICLSGSVQGKLAYLILQGREGELLEEAKGLQALFGEDFYLELQRHPMTEEQIRADRMDEEPWLLQNHRDFVRNQEIVNQRLMQLGKELGIPCVATNDIRYIERGDWRAHEILMNIQSGEPCQIWERDSEGNAKRKSLNPKREVEFSHEYYFKSAEEMAALFADCPEAIAATVAIAEKIDFAFDFKARHYPIFTPPTSETKEDYLRRLCEEGIPRRYTAERLAKVQEKYPGRDPLGVVKERLAYELEIIISKGMCDYLLIVHDFIAWAKGRKIPMGPGRGSGAGSIILFLIGITDMEPLRFHLFFERFINPERISYPDIDVDICMERRGEVIDYTVAKYGKDRVAQIITFGSMKAKMAIRDVGRVLNIPLPKVNQIAKLVPEELNITIEKALETDPDLRAAYESDTEVKELIDIAQKLEGSVRSTGIHAAGIIICGDPLTEHIPVCLPKDSLMLATQYSMKPVEAVGMLKIDFLGLKTLTSIQKTVDAIAKGQGKEIDWVNLPLDDPAAFSLMNQGKVLGIFQMESGGMQDLARQLHVDRFEEVIAVVALYRPGPMEMIPSFISRKHGHEPIEIDHPAMKEVLAETYGIMVYQEQVMQIASLLAGYSLGEGDVLRRAMGKKDREEMNRQRAKFLEGAAKKGLESDLAMKIFDKVEKFASYGFNKSHAAAYGYLAYVTAYLKANYPREWMAALMTCDRDDITKVARIVAECRAMQIDVLPPDVNESGVEFVATSKGIRFAMGGIKGIGEGVVAAIVLEREQGGPFLSLVDFLRRVSTQKIGKKTIEILIHAGGFDFIGLSRKALLEMLPTAYEMASQTQKEKAKGVIDLFASFAQEEVLPVPISSPEGGSRREILQKEKELLGFYLTGHPLEEFESQLQKLSCFPLGKLADLDPGSVVRVACVVDAVDVKISAKTQKKFAIVVIGNGTDRYELPIWSDLYEKKASLLTENRILYAVLQVDRVSGELKLTCHWICDLAAGIDDDTLAGCDLAVDAAKARAQRGSYPNKKSTKPREEKKMTLQPIKIELDAETVRLSHLLELKKIFRSHPGETTLHLEFVIGDKAVGTVVIEAPWGVSSAGELKRKVREISSVKGLKETPKRELPYA